MTWKRDSAQEGEQGDWQDGDPQSFHIEILLIIVLKEFDCEVFHFNVMHAALSIVLCCWRGIERGTRVKQRLDLGWNSRQDSTLQSHSFGAIAHVPITNRTSPPRRVQLSGIGSAPVRPKVSTKTATAI